jgi:DNA-binding response OmpR family regulator
MRTLILDDEEPAVHILSKVCRDEGHLVAPFTDSAKALVYLAREQVDLLITDLHMPGPDGVTVVLEARRLQPGIFTLIVTGHTNRYPIEALLADGTADVIVKPFRMDELRTRLALTERRRGLIARLQGQTRALYTVSNERIRVLQHELEQQHRSTTAADPATR